MGKVRIGEWATYCAAWNVVTFMATIPPQESGSTLELILDSSSSEELAQVLGGVRRSMPPEAFDAWLGNARQTLPPDSVALLESTLGRLAPA